MILRNWILYAPKDAGKETTDTGKDDETPLPETVVSDIPMPEGMDPQTWATLTDAEREALHITPEEVEADQNAEAGELSEDDLDGVLEGEEGATAEETAAEEVRRAVLSVEDRAAEDEAAAKLAAGNVDLPTDEDLLALKITVPTPNVPLPDDVPAELQTKLDEIEAKETALEDQFEAGDITRPDMKKVEKELAKERKGIEKEILNEQLTRRDAMVAEAQGNAGWQQAQKAFFAGRPEYRETEGDGKTYTVKASALYGAIDSQVKRLNADPANEAKSDMQILVEADRLVRKIFNLPAPSKKAAAAAASVKKDEKAPAAVRPKLKTLAGTPEAASSQDASPYANLMNLKGEEFERAIERMTTAQKEAFERWNAHGSR